MCNIHENQILHLTEVKRKLNGQIKENSQVLNKPHCHLCHGVGQMKRWEGGDGGEGRWLGPLNNSFPSADIKVLHST